MASLVWNKPTTQSQRALSLREAPIQPELIHTTPETLLLATITYLREKLPTHQFKIERVTEQEAVITHYLKDGGIEFFRLKLSR